MQRIRIEAKERADGCDCCWRGCVLTDAKTARPVNALVRSRRRMAVLAGGDRADNRVFVEVVLHGARSLGKYWSNGVC